MSDDTEAKRNGRSRSGSENVSDLIADRSNSLSAAEKKVARTLIADYPTAGLGTVASLAQAGGVSAPSVIRFVSALGFESFPSLQEALKDELRLRSEGPLGNIVWSTAPGSHSANIALGAETMAANATRSMRAIPPQELEKAIELLADTSRKVFTTGGRYSNILAKHLAINLETIRPKVRFVEHPLDSDLSTLISLGTRDIYVLFDFHRYQSSTVELARNIKRRGSTIILVTDERMSPAASEAQVVIPINVNAPSPFYTFSGGTRLVELIVLAVLQELGDKGRDYLARWDTTRQRELVAKPATTT